MAVTDTTRRELLEATDEQIDEALKYADPMVLRGLLYQLTGDEDITVMKLKWVRVLFVEAPTVESDDEVILRQKAAAFLRAYRDAGAGEMEIGPRERLRASIGLTVAADLDGDRLAMTIEELGLDPWVRDLEWRDVPDSKGLAGFSVTVVGAGLGGLTAALMLKRAGIPFTVVDKNPGVGGTWHENRYPGARVDIPSRGYTNIFAADFPYPNPFCAWEENQKYFDWVADTFGLRDDIVLNTEVHAMTWNEQDSVWEIDVAGPEGQCTIRSNAVITAVGFLNRLNVPEIEGMAEFAGRSWHTARWPADFNLKGARIAVIGTGASGYQTVPELALEADHVAVFQRTPSWVFPAPGYRSPFPPQVSWLDRNFPYYTSFMRIRTKGGAIGFRAIAGIDPDFDDGHAVSLVNKRMRDAAMDFLESKLGDHPELSAKMTPEYPVFGARPIIVDPEYSILDAILRDNVTLVTDGIRRITTTGIETNGGTHYDVDAIVYATGFHATEYLFPMTITGRNGQTIEAYWKDGGARAHRFCMVPGFPNMWTIYGPNTNGGLHPAAFDEMITLYAMQCIGELILTGKRTIEPKEDAYWQFAREVDEQNARMVWSDPRVHSYYWSRHDRSTTMCPLDPSDVWRMLRYPALDELEIR